ncbi:MAG TPA: hypothetical protein VFX60_19555 [Micromonospora sp.]|nr:hypothetical protein [Micromonospora sp.]
MTSAPPMLGGALAAVWDGGTDGNCGDGVVSACESERVDPRLRAVSA